MVQSKHNKDQAPQFSSFLPHTTHVTTKTPNATTNEATKINQKVRIEDAPNSNSLLSRNEEEFGSLIPHCSSTLVS